MWYLYIMKNKLDNYEKLNKCEMCEKSTGRVWGWIPFPNKQLKKFLCLDCHNQFAVGSYNYG